jgi:hypothetical protein
MITCEQVQHGRNAPKLVYNQLVANKRKEQPTGEVLEQSHAL